MSEEKKLTPMKAIRAKCIDCCCGQINEIRLCPITECPLHFYRFGKDPTRKKGPMTEEQKAKLNMRFGRAVSSENVNDSVEKE